MVNDVLAATNDPLTIVKTCFAVAVFDVMAHPQPEPDRTTSLNSNVRVNVRPGALPSEGGS